MKTETERYDKTEMKRGEKTEMEAVEVDKRQMDGSSPNGLEEKALRKEVLYGVKKVLLSEHR